MRFAECALRRAWRDQAALWLIGVGQGFMRLEDAGRFKLTFALVDMRQAVASQTPGSCDWVSINNSQGCAQFHHSTLLIAPALRAEGRKGCMIQDMWLSPELCAGLSHCARSSALLASTQDCPGRWAQSMPEAACMARCRAGAWRQNVEICLRCLALSHFACHHLSSDNWL